MKVWSDHLDVGEKIMEVIHMNDDLFQSSDSEYWIPVAQGIHDIFLVIFRTMKPDMYANIDSL